MLPYMSKAREYLAKAKQCDERAKRIRNPENREWRMTLASLPNAGGDGRVKSLRGVSGCCVEKKPQ